MTKLYSTSKLGDYLVAFRIATRSQIDGIRKNLTPTQMLGHALVQAGVVDRERCETIVHVQRLIQKTAKAAVARGDQPVVLSDKTFVGEILIALGFLTPEENTKWLAYQEERRARGENPGRLGELLVDNGVCQAHERDLAMQVQNWLRGVK